MSQTTSGTAKHSCENCGAVFESYQALGGHSAHCSEGADSTESEQSEAEAIRTYVLNQPEEVLEEALSEAEWSRGKTDSVYDAAAKCFISEADGDSEMYISLFGECSEADCSYGANGFEDEFCRSHQNVSSDDDSAEGTESTAEGSESTAEGGEERADYVANLVNNGVNPVVAEECAEERFS